jgi:hypothetical protein
MKKLVRLVASAGLAALGTGTTHARTGEPTERQRLQADVEALHAQLQEKAALLLAPSPEDAASWSEFLQQPDTGLVRLMPRERYEGILGMRGSGAYYSFAHLTHEYGRGSDIGLEQGQLQSGFAGLDLGILVRLDGLPLDKATLDHAAIRFLAAFKALPQEPAMRTLQRQAATGFNHAGLTFRSRVKAEPDTTYALRSISPGRSDVLVVFRIVRRDPDDSVVLVWQKLKEFPVR